jgi:hypothetical protein
MPMPALILDGSGDKEPENGREAEMIKLHYARDAEGKAVYAFMFADRRDREASRLGLVPVTAAEARKLYGKPTRSACIDWTFKSEVSGFVLPVSRRAGMTMVA